MTALLDEFSSVCGLFQRVLFCKDLLTQVTVHTSVAHLTTPEGVSCFRI
jgi:hypothetical protein